MAPSQAPKNHLDRLQRMATTPDCAGVHWERAIGPTSRRLDMTAVEAEQYILSTVQQLNLKHFVESVWQGGWCDVYGCYREGLGWYVKLSEDDDGLLVISHHEPERGAVTTVSGLVINVEET